MTSWLDLTFEQAVIRSFLDQSSASQLLLLDQ